MSVINIDESGLEVSNNELLVHINPDLTFSVLDADLEPMAVTDIRDLIDIAKLVEPELVARYGGYK